MNYMNIKGLVKFSHEEQIKRDKGDGELESYDIVGRDGNFRKF